MTDTVFSDDNPNPAEGTDQGVEGADEESLLEKYVGEGKKYKTVEDLAKAYAHAEPFIEQLQGENKSLREELDSRLNTETMFEKVQDMLNPKQENGEDKDNSQTRENSPPEAANNQTALTEDNLREMVNKIVEGRDKEKTAQQNIQTVDTKVKELYGDKASEFVQKRAQELQVGVNFLQDTAAKSPAAFFHLVGINPDATPQAPNEVNPVKSSVNTAVQQGSGPKEGTYKYYNQLRKDNPRVYWSPKIQNEIVQKRKELGDAFWD